MEILDLNIPLIEDNSKDQLQRTKEWFEARRGLITGSGVKKLMSVERAESKMEWGRPEKMISFGITAKKYIFEKAKETQRNKVVHIPATASMKYGTNNEDIVFSMLKEKYITSYDFEKCDFIKVPKFEHILGASPDGKCISKIVKDEVIGLEIKCVTGWDGLYDRHEEKVSESHIDFWQLNTEMLSLEAKEIMYVVAEPSENIFEPNITDLSIQFVKSSPIHQECIIKRAMIGNEVIKMWLKQTESIHDCFQYVCTNYDYETEYNKIINQ